MGRILWRAAWPLLLLAVVQVPVAAQVGRRQPPPDWRTTPMLGFGYVGNGPRALLGANLYMIRPVLGGIGLYADFKITDSDPADSRLMVKDRTRAEAEADRDFWEADHEYWRVFNLAVIRPISPELALYVGGGYAKERSYADFWGESEQFGVNGHYRIEDETNSGTRTNVLGGAIFRIGGRVAVHFGAESAPAGFNAGVSLTLPLH